MCAIVYTKPICAACQDWNYETTTWHPPKPVQDIENIGKRLVRLATEGSIQCLDCGRYRTPDKEKSLMTPGDMLRKKLNTRKQFFIDNPEATEYLCPRPAGAKNLRLDFELTEEALTQDEFTNEHALTLMWNQFEVDLLDLIWNGDVEKSSDPLLKAMNGINKVNKPVSDILLGPVKIYRTFKPLKNTWEYTLYISMAIEWGGQEPLVDAVDAINRIFGLGLPKGTKITVNTGINHNTAFVKKSKMVDFKFGTEFVVLTIQQENAEPMTMEFDFKQSGL